MDIPGYLKNFGPPKVFGRKITKKDAPMLLT
jgi:hypothetical protein